MTDEVYNLLTAPRRTKYKMEQIKARSVAIRYTLLPSGIRYDTDRVQSSPSDLMPEKMALIDQLDRELKELDGVYDRQIDNIRKACDEMGKEPEKTIIIMQYIGGRSMIEIADVLNYSVSYAYRIRENGYALLHKVLASR